VVATTAKGAAASRVLENNAEDTGQSVADVVADFASEGWAVSWRLWTPSRRAGGRVLRRDMRDGYVVAAASDRRSAVKVSYAKFS